MAEEKRVTRTVADFVKGYLSLHFLEQTATPIVAFPDEAGYDQKVQALLEQADPINRMAIEVAYKNRKAIIGFALLPKPKKPREKRRKF